MSEQGNLAPDAWPTVPHASATSSFPHLSPKLAEDLPAHLYHLSCRSILSSDPCRYWPPGPGLGMQAFLSSLWRLASRRGPCWPGSKAGAVILEILRSRYMEYDPEGSPKLLVDMSEALTSSDCLNKIPEADWHKVQKLISWECPASPVVRTLCFHCRGHVFDPSLENEDLIIHLGWLKNEIDFFMVLEADEGLGRFGFF